MSPRSLRRAAEHKARKLAAKQLKDSGLTEAPPATSLLATTVREGAAVCPSDFSFATKPANLSTGPRTPEGKAISSMNALRTGLTGRTVLLSSDDADLYAAHIESYRAEFAPVGYRELELVQSLADTSWRLRRIPGLEMSIHAVGRHELADSFNEYDPSLRPGLIELEIHLKYEKVLRNLQLQESRLTRRFANDAKELRDLQAQRKAEESTLDSDQPPAPKSKPVPARAAHQAAAQFEFSTEFLAASAVSGESFAEKKSSEIAAYAVPELSACNNY